MKQLEIRALRLLERLQTAYLEEGDTGPLFSALDADLLWSLPAGKKGGRGAAPARKALSEDFGDFCRPMQIVEHHYEAREIAEDCCLVQGTLHVKYKSARAGLRLSAVCRFAGEEERICGLHVSDMFQGGANELNNHIPGGTFRCLFDDALTLLQVNNGFLTMLGYTREEIRVRFHDSFRKMIFPGDWEETLASVYRQLAQGDTKELEYRMICGDGSVIWVLDKGRLLRGEDGSLSFYCLLVDITKSKKAQEALRLSLERHEIIMNQTTDIIFEWDMLKDTLLFSSNWKKKFGYEPSGIAVSKRIPFSPRVCREDAAALLQVMERAKAGRPYSELELRLANGEGRFFWCRLRATTQYDDGKRPVKAVGVIIDIDHEKARSQMLLEKAERDALTGLYNKGAAQALIEKSLRLGPGSDMQALLIFDIDNFKHVNDTFGHLCGDAVLADVAEAAKKLFRSSDILGRIGGDEFAVLIKSISGEEAAAAKARQLIEMFHSLNHHEKGCVCSCSVGIALYPQDGTGFKDLYRHADKALYTAKERGKNQYAFYSAPGTAEVVQSSVNETIDSNSEVGVLNNQLAEYVFRVLYRSMRIEAAIPVILEIVGCQFDVSRVYIFENSEDNRTSCNTFEWCNEGVAPQIENLKEISFAGLDHFEDSFDQNGMFICEDISHLPESQRTFLERQSVKSLLLCAIRDNGVFRGIVGFDECRRAGRAWTEEQRAGLSFISQLVSIFLFKTRAQAHVEQADKCLRTILDSQEAWIYVLDESYRILYGNRKTRELIPEAEEGAICYRALLHRETPCEFCPMREIGDGDSFIMKIDNPVIRRSFHTEIKRIPWHGGREEFLFTCRMLPEYEEE